MPHQSETEEERRRRLGIPEPPPGFVSLSASRSGRVADDSSTAFEIPPPPEGFISRSEASGGETDVGRALQQPIQGFNETFAAIAGFPGDVVNPLARGFGAERDILPGSETLRETFVRGPEPQTGLERSFRRGGKVAGEALSMAAPILRGARAIPRPPTPGPQGLRQQVIQSVAEAPAGRALATDANLGFLSGAAGEGAVELTGEERFRPAGEIIGGFGPAATTSLIANSPTGLAARFVKTAVSRFVPSQRAKLGQEQAKRIVGEAVGDLQPFEVENIRVSEGVRKQIPGLKPSIGEASGSPALVAQQQALESGMAGRALETQAARRLANQQAIGGFEKTVAPPTTGENIDFVVEAASGRVMDVRDRITASQEDISTRQQVLAGRIPTVDRAEAGAQMRGAIIDRRREVSDEMSALADELGINNADVTVQSRGVFESIRDSFAPTRFGNPKARPDVLDDIDLAIEQTAAGVPVTFQDFKSLRERVSNDLIDAMSGANPNKQLQRSLVEMKITLDDQMKTLTFPDDPELAQRYQQFRQSYFDDFVTPFENNAAFRIRQRGAKGFFQTQDEKVFSTFFGPGKLSNIRQWKQIFGDDPDALQSFSGMVLDDLRQVAVVDGVINQKQLDGWLAKHRTVLDEIPSVRNLVSQIGDANQAMLGRMAQLDGRQKTMETSALFKELQASSSALQTRTPEESIARLMRDPRKMQSFMSAIKANSAATEALKRHVWDGVQQADAEKMARYMNDNEQSLRVVLGDAHFRNLTTINDAMRIVERVPPPPGRGVVTDPLERFTQERIGVSPQEIQNTIYRFGVGFVGAKFITTNFFSKIFRNKSARAMEATFTETLYDPELAQELADIALIRKSAPIKAAKKLNTFLFSVGIDPFGEDENTAPSPE